MSWCREFSLRPLLEGAAAEKRFLMFSNLTKSHVATRICLFALLPAFSIVGCGMFPCGCRDNAAPTVISVIPADGTTGVAINQVIAATFSEGMDEASLDTATFLNGPGNTPVVGTIAYDGASNTVTFTPTGSLAPNTEYTAALTTAALDLEGKPLAAIYTWVFTTGVALDTTAPLVILTNPDDAATDVAINRKVTATFNEPMDPSTIIAANMTLVGPGGTSVTGTVSYAAVSNTATFKSASNLAINTVFIATVSTGVRDLAGNAMAASKIWTFTTGATADTTAPTVTSTSPIDLATGVPVNKSINATFSEAMDPSTISTTQFLVTGPGSASVAGVVSYDPVSHIATFVATSDFAPNTAYTARITTGVRDLADNALASEYVWSFTTGTTRVQESVVLRSLSAFAAVAGAGLTKDRKSVV